MKIWHPRWAWGWVLMRSMATERYLSARRMQHGKAGKDECVWMDAQGRVQAVLPLPARGHSFAIDASRGQGPRRAVVFGRQPGFFAWAFQLPDADQTVGAALQPEPLPLPAGHHFYGHGVYAPDGHTLYATENDYVHARGVIGVYDVRPGRACVRLKEFDSGGIGPHEIVLMPDGQTLCVANGGLQTHPDFGKTILNAATMESSLVYLNRHTGQIVDRHFLTVPRLSLRHLAVDGAGRVWAGCQYLNADGQQPALVWRHGQEQDLHAAPCPPQAQRGMRNYVGSMAANRRGDVVAASSPHGGRVLFWHLGRMGAEHAPPRLLGALELPDVCGLAPWDETGFLLSSGHGVLMRYDPQRRTGSRALQRVCAAWDNHLVSL